MVNSIMKQEVDWFSPMPLWAENTSLGILKPDTKLSVRPVILRFANDAFMDEILNVVKNSPERLHEWIAEPETWRQPMSKTKVDTEPEPESQVPYLLNKTKNLTDLRRKVKNKIILSERKNKNKMVLSNRADNADELSLKLYQAGHQRFYLVCASLMAPEVNFRDHSLDPGKNENASFVVRRLVPSESGIDENPDQWDEYAYVDNGGGFAWRKIAAHGSSSNKKLIRGEEKIPMFPVPYRDGCGCNRSLLSGLIPVGKRESWMGAQSADVSPIDDAVGREEGKAAQNDSQARLIFRAMVTEPWNLMVEQAFSAQSNSSQTIPGVEGNSNKRAEETRKMINAARDQIQTVSWYVLLDLAKFLRQYIPSIWNVVIGESSESILDVNERELYEVLLTTEWSEQLENSLIPQDELIRVLPNVPRKPKNYSKNNVFRGLVESLREIALLENNLENVETPFIRFDDRENPIDTDGLWPHFLFPLADPVVSGFTPNVTDLDTSGLTDLEITQAKIDALGDMVDKILPEVEDEDPLPGTTASLDPQEGWFVVRCVYEKPHCGPLFPALVSEPSRIFQLAPFFDPDAPARPVRIPLPVDISPAGLRKYKKNASFIISDMLCGKIKKIRKMTLGDLVLSVLPWPFHKDLPNLEDTKPCGKGGLSFGMICSISIPIVTIVALVLMIIMVTLFNIFFFWLPYLFICLPIPGFKTKKS